MGLPRPSINTMTHPQQLQTEICYIADDFLKHMSVLEMTLKVTTESMLEATKCLPNKERKALQHVIERVSPIGLKNLLEAVQMTASRTNHLRTEIYTEAAKALVDTIYTQKGVAGPTSERTFNNVADGNAAALKEVATPKLTTPVVIPAIKKSKPQVDNAERKAAMELYRQWALKCPLVKCLGKPTEPPSDTHLWVMACGYVMASKEEAQATLRIGLNALLWSTSDGVNVVEKVKRFTHPSSEGCVYVLNMSKTTTQAETNHLATLTDSATWVMPEYPHLIVVELSPKYSKEHPFNGKTRKGWDAIKQYMDSQIQ